MRHMEGPSWREVEHTADWALEVWGKTPAALFRNAALGMASLLGGQPTGDRVSKRLRLQAPDAETLLVDWLTELLFWVEEEDLVLEDVRIEAIEETSLTGQAVGREGTDLVRHIKAVTYNDLAIRSAEEGLKTTIVFDV
jgi:SHS2 domain-containing protein